LLNGRNQKKLGEGIAKHETKDYGAVSNVNELGTPMEGGSLSVWAVVELGAGKKKFNTCSRDRRWPLGKRTGGGKENLRGKLT